MRDTLYLKKKPLMFYMRQVKRNVSIKEFDPEDEKINISPNCAIYELEDGQFLVLSGGGSSGSDVFHVDLYNKNKEFLDEDVLIW